MIKVNVTFIDGQEHEIHDVGECGGELLGDRWFFICKNGDGDVVWRGAIRQITTIDQSYE